MKILIDNSGYELKNYGDSAMLVGTANRLHRQYPHAKIQIFTLAPERLAKLVPYAVPVGLDGRKTWHNAWNIFGGLHNLLPRVCHIWLQDLESLIQVQFPRTAFKWIEWRLSKRKYDLKPVREYLSTLFQSDIVIASGGGYITDSFEGHACDLLKTMALAQSFGKPTAMFGQGLGPVKSKKILKWSKRVLPRLNILSLREGLYSLSFAQNSGIAHSKINVTGDDAIMMVNHFTSEIIGSMIGVNIRVASYSGLKSNELGIIRSILNGTANRLGAKLCGVPIAFHDEDSDFDAIRNLLGPNIFDNDETIDLPESVIKQVGNCRMIVTGSYHAGVFALSQGVGVVAIVASDYYRQKFEGLKSQFGVGCRIVDKKSTQFEQELETSIKKCWLQADEVRSVLLEKAREQVKLCDSVYEQFVRSVNNDS